MALAMPAKGTLYILRAGFSPRGPNQPDRDEAQPARKAIDTRSQE
jgi:hypothetical protein